MNRNILHGILTWIGILLLAGVFFAAAIPKILDPDAFARSIVGYKMLPDALVNAPALILPQLEAIAAAALFVPRLRRAGLAWIGLMLLLFTLAQMQAIFRGIEGGCGCFGSGEGHEGDSIGWKGVIRNVGLLLVTSALWLKSSVRSPRKGA